MRCFKLFTLLTVLFMPNWSIGARTQAMDIPLTISDGTPNGIKVLHFGIDLTTTDGIEAALGETETKIVAQPIWIQKPVNLVRQQQANLQLREPKARLGNHSPQGWQTLISEDFSAGFPSARGWNIFYDPIAPYFWDDVSAQAHTGSASGWCVGGAALGFTPPSPNTGTYVNNMESWMTFGPFDLSDATDAKLELWYWLDSEQNHDYFSFLASTDFNNWGGFDLSGNSNGYQSATLDLANVPKLGNLVGGPNVYIGFRFKADGAVARRGVFLDDILLQKFINSTPSCTFRDNFDDGVADGWTPLTPTHWQVSNDAGSLRYFLNTTNYDSPDNIRLGELSLLNSRSWSDFSLECLAKSADAANGSPASDLCIIFGYQDFDSYYYMMFNSEPGLTQLFRNHNGNPAVILATYNQATFADGEYHSLRVERTGNLIRAYFDGRQIISASDSFFGAGPIGVGSRNDFGYFDNISIEGDCQQQFSNLVPTALSFNPASANPGGAINFSGTVTNNGNAATGANIKINFFLSTDPSAPNYNLFLHSFFMNDLAAGQSSSFNQTGTVPVNTGAGLYYVWISLDPDNTINESNEADNQLRTTSQVQVTTPPLPNLVTTVLSFNPALVNPGGAINLSGTVTNNGNAVTGANVKINLFLSTDPNAPNYNFFLHSFFMNALAAGQSSSFNQVGTVPANTGAGLYYVWMSLDPDNTITESNENDNQSHTTSQVQVVVTPPPCQLIWKVDVTLQDAGNNSALLSFGLGTTATDDIDAACGEAELPPTPPTGIFDARLELPVSPAKASLKDYRNSSQQVVNWRTKFQPGVNGPMTFSWNPATFPAGCFLLKDEITGTLVNIDMKTQSSYSLTNLAITSLKIEFKGSVPTCKTCRDVTVAAGWNIVSIPVLADNMAVSALFPDAASQAFAFNNGYTNATTLTNGKGYWIKFNAAKAYNICGLPATPKRIPVLTGWNIIGPFETDIPVANITSSPANIITSSYFGYNNGYTQATILSAGKGYWVKASVAGDLIIPGSAMTKQTAETEVGRMVQQSEVNASWPMLVIADSRGNSGRIYLAPSAEIDANFEMPPVPPSGIFDVRFSSGRCVETLESGALEIQINSASYPIRIRTQNLGDRTLNVKDALGGNALHEALTSGKEIVVSKAIDKIMVETAIQLPSRYALSQNYPNPFNPTTIIRFAVPEKGHVKLTLYSVVGEKLAELVNQELPAGYHQVEFNANNFASGVYFYEMRSGNFRDLKKLLLQK